MKKGLNHPDFKHIGNAFSERVFMPDDVVFREYRPTNNKDAAFVGTFIEEFFGQSFITAGLAFYNNNVKTLCNDKPGRPTQFRLLPAMSDELRRSECSEFFKNMVYNRRIWMLSDARNDDHIMGFIIAELQARTPVVHFIGVSKKSRRKGYARWMLEALSIVDYSTKQCEIDCYFTFPPYQRMNEHGETKHTRQSLSWGFDWLQQTLKMQYNPFALAYSLLQGRRIYPSWVDEPASVVTQSDEDENTGLLLTTLKGNTWKR